jgi:phage-related minor tail protein
MADETPAAPVPADGGGASSDLPGVMDKLSTQTANLTAGANTFARAMSTAFTQAATSGKGLDSVLQSLALRLSNMAVSAAFRPLTSALTSGLGNLFGGGTGGSAGGDDKLLSSINDVQAFASGGVIGTPTYFPMTSGTLGLAGEAGPEAIMPLARGADGRLGVASAGGGGAAANVTVHVNTPDASSFRRSEAYITGRIARAVARGQRSL